jgi:hypothetical protein
MNLPDSLSLDDEFDDLIIEHCSKIAQSIESGMFMRFDLQIVSK